MKSIQQTNPADVQQPPLILAFVSMENNKRKELIASCGMDCGLCSGYLAYSHSIPKKKDIIYWAHRVSEWVKLCR